MTTNQNQVPERLPRVLPMGTRAFYDGKLTWLALEPLVFGVTVFCGKSRHKDGSEMRGGIAPNEIDWPHARELQSQCTHAFTGENNHPSDHCIKCGYWLSDVGAAAKPDGRLGPFSLEDAEWLLGEARKVDPSAVVFAFECGGWRLCWQPANGGEGLSLNVEDMRRRPQVVAFMDWSERLVIARAERRVYPDDFGVRKDSSSVADAQSGEGGRAVLPRAAEDRGASDDGFHERHPGYDLGVKGIEYPNPAVAKPREHAKLCSCGAELMGNRALSRNECGECHLQYSVGIHPQDWRGYPGHAPQHPALPQEPKPHPSDWEAGSSATWEWP